uniref:Uncharacterized protein n=1 Tax=Anguilla anguilla TaxID=7936 RepID=A0A0E9RKR0_ANGAN
MFLIRRTSVWGFFFSITRIFQSSTGEASFDPTRSFVIAEPTGGPFLLNDKHLMMFQTV